MKQLPSLNGLRAVSIIVVILFHLTRFNLLVDQDLVLRIPLLNGRFGVNIFFVISGFLITSLLLSEEEIMGSISIRDFYIRRVLRIFPAYFFLLSVYLILQLYGYLHISGPAWFTALTYTKYLNYQAEFYTSHAWSLSIEENFYLFWPLVFLAGNKTRKDLVAYLILIVPLIRLFLYYNPVAWASEQSIFTRIDSIATGCFIALKRNELLLTLGRHWNRWIYTALAAIFLVPWISHLADGTYMKLFFVLFGDLTGTIANFAIAIIILYSVYGPKGWWHHLLNKKAFTFIGTLSYSLYLWQQLYIAKRSWWITHFPQNIILIFLTAVFSYYVVERPFLKLKARYTRRNRRFHREPAALAKV